MPCLITLKASSLFLGILRVVAKPFPDPNLIIPSLTLVPIKHPATSFIVPSPPQATIISTPFLIDSKESSMAWDGLRVSVISTLNVFGLNP